MAQQFSGLKRAEQLAAINKHVYDMIVIGGGITGAGIALDATTRGINVAVFEMQDFAAGTSSRSTKLVHGGLRYLKQFEVKMVAEVGKERAIVYENGPHVTTPEWMLLPMHKGGTFGPFSTSIGLRVYDFLAGVKRSEWRSMLSPEQTLAKEPLVKQEGLKGGGYYVEYRTDDARLTIEVMKEAVHRGATAMNYAKVDAFIYDEAGKVKGVRVIDVLTGTEYEVYAKKIVNAAGPWVDTLREKDGSKTGKKLQLSKGVHLVIDQSRFPLKQAIYFDTPDGRMVFAIPRDGKAYVGTTDTFYKEDAVHPKMTVADRKYVIDAINYMFPSVKITEDDIESSWAGVRPLIYEEGKSASEISRKDEIWQSASGLITIAGGKLTGYRKMAELVVDLVANLLKQEGNGSYKACSTKHMPISGGAVGGSAGFPAFVQRKADEGVGHGLTREQAQHLVHMYGSNVDHLYDIIAKRGTEAKEAGLAPDVFAQLVYAIEQEMVVKPVDFFIRRTGALFFNISWVRAWKTPVITYMANDLGWSDEEKRAYTDELEQRLTEAVVPEELL
ncbi:glycerol-3-phosphate dehydrogenase/oxidase [Aneurinibacillus uraniidurans]|uniref:glycerol-3-phosphate dehydrogenase/oxidase n=1 Tax=Aneurinibacillus uraniidurans TaxID=2966586 RepID=UPI00234ABC0E|nr:glycerol-3-phosphate dehydrogenase/oxidase [Aneurinibacillus sp. B1]WCN38347.1 glycerol-3-phosphate dehydrogenase/oxidase [Aneurinibacillus sp. B1]